MPSKKTVVADTSALVSLELAGTLDASLSIISWQVPKAVIEELNELAEFDDALGKAAKRVKELVQKENIQVHEIESEPSISKMVDRGEACAFSLCLKEKIKLLACDDVEAGYRLDGLARANQIRIVIGAAVIVELVKQKIWTKKQAIGAVSKMIRQRDWEGGVLAALSRKYLENL